MVLACRKRVLSLNASALQSAAPRRETGRQGCTGLSLPRPRRLPHPAVYTKVLTPAQAETEPWLLHPAGPRHTLLPLGSDKSGPLWYPLDLTGSLRCQCWTQGITGQRAGVQMEEWRSPAACAHAPLCFWFMVRVFLRSTKLIEGS